MNTLRWIIKALNKRKWMVGLLTIVQSIMAISGIAFALLMRSVIDHAVSKEYEEFWQSVVALAVLICLQLLLRFVNRFLEEDTHAAIENRLRQKTLHGILQSNFSRVKEYHTGELMNRITSDVGVVTDGAVTLVPSLTSMAVRIVGVLLVMGSIDWTMALVFLIAGCFVAALSVLPRRWQKRLHKKVQEADGNVKSYIQESLESLLVIHAFGCEDKIENSSLYKMKQHRHIRRKRTNLFNVMGTGLRLCIQGGYLFGLAWCGLGIIEGKITYGTLTAVIQLIGQIQTPFANIGSTFPKYSSMLASAERLMEITEQAECLQLAEGSLSREEIYQDMQSIRFEDVSFAYDADRPVLQKESFAVHKGEFVALIGSSGIGKSTIMKLLLSVYQPQEGKIEIETNQEKLSLSQLPAGMFAYVPQGNYLMSGPIWEVVGFAEKSENIDRHRVEEACKAACAHEFICELPKGYDTVLGERGDGLSEGQMQRLAVARAVYSGCPVLLLDEATSALDADTERRMITSLKQMSEYTVFLVTHRKEVWELCDRVLERKE
ncbi:MAG: ABC transporter ATP-binding protein [Tyzzerella sp.]|nr:ABC transporter ATP-binding protein [Tyzzerella sp.]